MIPKHSPSSNFTAAPLSPLSYFHNPVFVRNSVKFAVLIYLFIYFFKSTALIWNQRGGGGREKVHVFRSYSCKSGDCMDAVSSAASSVHGEVPHWQPAEEHRLWNITQETEPGDPIKGHAASSMFKYSSVSASDSTGHARNFSRPIASFPDRKLL